MDHSGPSSGTVPYRCSRCSRAFVVVGEDAAAELLCVCGAPLARRALPRGVYEVHPPLLVDPGAAARPPRPSEVELDRGYGASHGNDPPHSGPTGPGDAPGDVPESPPARPAPLHSDDPRGGDD